MLAKTFGAIAAAAAASMIVTPALAAPAPVLSGYVDGGYNYTTIDSFHFNDWKVEGGVVAPISSMFAVQGNLAYDSLSIEGFHENTTTAQASVFATLSQGRLGVSGGYNNIDVFGSNAHFENYGVFGDWYVSDVLTLSARGGGLTGSGFSGGNDNYIGGQIVGYPCPNLALTGTIDNLHLDFLTQTAYSVGAEYQISKTLPLSVSLGYTDTNLSAGSTIVFNTYSVGLKYYFGPGASLRDHQRSGAEGWGATSPISSLFLF
jgi:hypothetical protein